MKKSLIILSFAFIFIFLLSASIISSHKDAQGEKISFGDWLKGLWGKITGQQTLQVQRGSELCKMTNIDGDDYILNQLGACSALAYDCNDNNARIFPGNPNTFCDCETANNPAQGATEVCGNSIDEDCDGVVSVCSPTCSNDIGCISSGLKQCSGSGYRTCGNYDADSCLEWGLLNFCLIGQTCLGGVCSTCSNDIGCTSSGLKQCSGTTGYKTCGNSDADSCLEWSTTVTACSIGQTCSNGVCVSAPPTSTCTDSDGGLNYTAPAGSTSNGTLTKLDTCYLTTNILTEYKCDVNAVVGMNYTCDFGCSNGACNKCSQSSVAAETDISIKGLGDTCTSNGAGIYESSCIDDFSVGASSTPVSCPTGKKCYDGACTNCYDSDNGINYTVSGTAWNNTYSFGGGLSDNCANSTHLNEYSCSGSNINLEKYKCSLLGASYACDSQNKTCACNSNWQILDCYSNETAVWSDLNGCGKPPETSYCDYNKNNLICESFPGIESVGINGLLLNVSKNYTNIGIGLVELAQPGSGGVDFNWNFANPLNFCNIEVEVADSSAGYGYTIVRNAGVSNKTVWVERLNKTSKAVCLKDVPGEVSISEFSNTCTGSNEVLVSCPSGINSTYKCEIVKDTPPSTSSWFKVWPLNNSAVKEMTGLVSGALLVGNVCQENWNCTNWTDVNDIGEGCGTKNCTDLNNCRTVLDKPLEIKSCIQEEECVPSWTCTGYGKCVDGFKERVCTDSEGCGDDATKPSEISECKGKSPILIIILAIVGLLLIIFLIWYFARKKDEGEYSEETQAPASPPSPPRPPANVYTPRPAQPYIQR